MTYYYLHNSADHRSAWSKLFGLSLQEWQRASRLVYEADSVGVPSDAFLDDEGSVAVAFYDNDRCLEVVIEKGGPMTFMLKRGYGFDFKLIAESEDASENEVIRWIHRLSGKPLWSSSGSFVQVGGTTTRVVSPTWLSSDPQTPGQAHQMGMAAYPYLTRVVP